MSEDNKKVTDFICRRCGEKLTTKQNLIRHIKSKNICEVTVENISKEDYLKSLQKQVSPHAVACRYCGALFNHANNVYTHHKICKKNPNSDKYVDEGVEKEPISPQQEIALLKEKLIKKNKEITDLKKENKELKMKEKELIESTHIQVVFNIQSDFEIQQNKKYKKKNIPQPVRISCWNTHVGETVGKTKCLCCNNVDITQHNFHCGHIVAERLGGTCDISNILPICNVCNYSMGTMNMNEFKQMYGFINK